MYVYGKLQYFLPRKDKVRMLLSKLVQIVKSKPKIVSSTTDLSMTLITFISEH
jgi:hypothetical protein